MPVGVSIICDCFNVVQLTLSFGFLSMNACIFARRLARLSGGKTRSSRDLAFKAIQFPKPSILPKMPLVAPCTFSPMPPGTALVAVPAASPILLSDFVRGLGAGDGDSRAGLLAAEWECGRRRGLGEGEREVSRMISARLGWFEERTSSLRGWRCEWEVSVVVAILTSLEGAHRLIRIGKGEQWKARTP